MYIINNKTSVAIWVGCDHITISHVPTHAQPACAHAQSVPSPVPSPTCARAHAQSRLCPCPCPVLPVLVLVPSPCPVCAQFPPVPKTDAHTD
jgi:hypothetical protein